MLQNKIDDGLYLVRFCVVCWGYRLGIIIRRSEKINRTFWEVLLSLEEFSASLLNMTLVSFQVYRLSHLRWSIMETTKCFLY